MPRPAISSEEGEGVRRFKLLLAVLRRFNPKLSALDWHYLFANGAVFAGIFGLSNIFLALLGIGSVNLFLSLALFLGRRRK